ncbi:hypothetical protein NDU88_002650 [Pleurodeles waltl]|uniref:Uncharacterized protein n=1 Tax=Pleurodeles waltl TaxID=8319 RepID=A0AAV7WSB1_PLEWA|nr:hypothetical protein NDU88_002650 [Pleurodeles waltl]
MFPWEHSQRQGRVSLFPGKRSTSSGPWAVKRKEYATGEESESKERRRRVGEQRSSASQVRSKKPKTEERRRRTHTKERRSHGTQKPATTPEGRGLQSRPRFPEATDLEGGRKENDRFKEKKIHNSRLYSYL